uniref:ASH domain-containing protein n=1 Tax=Taenia asiatica TaxID=60517 RepID=A0A158R9E6_TAEAS
LDMEFMNSVASVVASFPAEHEGEGDAEGIVSPNACQNCEITYQYSFNGGGAATKKTTYSLSAFLGSPFHLDGVTTQVNVLLHLSPPKLNSISKRINLGDVPYGLEITRIFRLWNVGSGPAFVEFHAPSVINDVNLNVDPSQVEIRSQEDAAFKVTCYSRRTGYFEIPISIYHASKEVMQITAQGMCVFPKVEVFPPHMRLRCGYRGAKVLGTPVGEKSKDSFTVKNVSPVPARIEFELNDCRSFSVENETPDLLKPFLSKTYVLTFKPEKAAFQLNFGSQELVVQLQIESSRIFAISNRPQPPCLLFIAESGERLMAYQRELDSRTSRVMERWLRHYGLPGGIHGLNFPIDFQRCLSLHHIRVQEQHQKNDQVVHSLDVLVECLAHMAGFWSLHGVPRSLTLPIGDTVTCIGALYNHHAALVCFVESQGGCVGHIAPEHLMTYIDYLDWICNGRPCGCEDPFNVDIPNMATLDGVPITPTVILSSPDGKVCLRYPMTPILEKEAFERASRIAWTDLFLQLLRVNCFLSFA